MFALLLATAMPSFASGQPCNGLQLSDLSGPVANAMSAAQTGPMSYGPFGEVVARWFDGCEEDRRRIGQEAAREIAPLLEFVGYRYYLSVILVDIGPEARVIRPQVRRALADQLRREREWAHDGLPDPPTGYDLSKSLRCVLRIIDTGRRNHAICADLLRAVANSARPVG